VRPLSSTKPIGPADRRLAHYVRRTVYPYSAYYRATLDKAGVGARIRTIDLARVPPTDLLEVADPASLVLRPDLATIVREGQRGLAVRVAAAKLSGGMHSLNGRVIEHRFKPVHWVMVQGVPIGYSSADLQRLAARGSAWLTRAGVRRHDVVLSLVSSGQSVAHWQLVLGCRRAGISAIHIEPDTDAALVERLAPSVLAGDPQHLVALLAQARASGRRLPNLRTVLAVGDPIGGDLRTHLSALAGGAAVVGAWAPSGVRALWSECRLGAAGTDPTGYHAWDSDVLELSPAQDGSGAQELLWTGVGWNGTALLKLRTFTSAALESAVCPACGVAGARVLPLAPIDRNGSSEAGGVVTDGGIVRAQSRPAPRADAEVAHAGAEAILEAEPEVAAWQVEYRMVDGHAETIVVLALAWGAALVPLLRRLDRHLRATQFVVLSLEEVAARIETAAGQRVVGAADAPPRTIA